MDDVFYIYGKGSLGKEVATFLKSKKENKIYNFVDDIKSNNSISLNKFAKIKNKKKLMIIAIMDPVIRKKIFKKSQRHADYFNAIHDTSLIFTKKIGKGNIIYPFVTISNNTKIGNFFLANLYSFVGHDCEIGNFVTLGPHAKCCGNVKINDNVTLGAGSTILQGIKKKIKIGKNSIIGAGSVVYDDVPENCTVMGNPAKIVFKNDL